MKTIRTIFDVQPRLAVRRWVAATGWLAAVATAAWAQSPCAWGAPPAAGEGKAVGRYRITMGSSKELSQEVPADVVADWKDQDHLTGRPPAYRETIRAILAELGGAGPALGGETPPPGTASLPPGAAAPPSDEVRTLSDALAAFQKLPPDDSLLEGLYLQACQARRRHRLEHSLLHLRRVIFTRHFDMGGSHYAYTEGQSDAQNERHFQPGSSLCLLEMQGLYAKVRTLVDDPRGVIRDPDVSYDGRRVLFAWKKSLNHDDYHLYELNVDDGRTHQLTSGLGFADYEGAYVPTGDIVFTSTRCVQTVDCWWTEVSTLFTCDRDGRYLRRLSYDQVHTNFPTVMEDGRVIYTRWDYNDRGQIYPQGLFQMYPDGTGQTALYGNNSWFPTTILHARCIPGTGKIVCVFSGHHTIQKGWLAVLDPSRGHEENQGAQLIAPVRRTDALHVDAYGQGGDQFQYPYPLSDREFLVTFKPEGSRGHFAIYWMDQDARRELLVSDPAISCNQPVPLAARAVPPPMASTVDYRKDSGTFYVQDVYRGPGLAGVARGTIKSLRVVALEFRAAGIGSNTNQGPAGGALASTPVSIQGTWDVKVVLGSTPVHEDGSACFVVPANTPVYFQALDANRRAVQTMRSWAQVQPGESFSCAGCHEDKNTAPPAGTLTRALREGPRRLDPFYGPPRGFSFHSEIQPILDRHCIRCHFQNEPSRLVNPHGPLQSYYQGGPQSPDLAAAARKDPSVKPAFSLLGAEGVWSPAYRSLANRRVADWINIQSAPPLLPAYSAGAARSKLVQILRDGHEGVRLSNEEMDKIACWIDLLVPCFGDYREGLTPQEKEKYNFFLAKRKRWEEEQKRNVQELIRARGH